MRLGFDLVGDDDFSSSVIGLSVERFPSPSRIKIASTRGKSGSNYCAVTVMDGSTMTMVMISHDK